MSKEKNNALVPRLRFPEFQEEGEWDTTKLYEVRDTKIKWSFTGGPFGSSLKASDFIHSGIRVIQLQNIGDGKFIDDYKVFTSRKKADELLSCNIYPGEIILSKMGDPVGRACIIPEKQDRYIMCSDGIRLVIDESRYDKYFIFVLINTEQFRNQIEKTATGSTRKRIGLDELKKIPLYYPYRIEEQQKIATTLTTLDELIAAQTKKINALKAHKKGLMQLLFPAEGERVPRLRFPEFQEEGEWEEKPLNQLLKIGNGRDYKHLSKGSIPVYGSGGYMLSVNEWLYAGDSVCIGRKGTINKPMLLNGKFWVVDTLFYTHSFNDCSPNFIYTVFQNINWMNYNEAGGVPSLTKTTIEKIEILVPKIFEQQKIADAFTSLDDLIAIHVKKIDTINMFKKGLMQQLFPDPNNEIQ